jgi:hypothetical protein
MKNESITSLRLDGYEIVTVLGMLTEHRGVDDGIEPFWMGVQLFTDP